MRILWVSNAPWSPSGYGTQTRLIVPRLRALGHEIALQCVPGLDGGTIGWEGMRVYPRGPHPFGQSSTGAHYRHFQADLMLTMHDAWIIEPRLLGDDVRWAAWYPCDHEGLPPQVREKLMESWARFCFTRAGQAEANAVGVASGWIPLAVDTSVFQPGDREAGRRALSIPSDAYLLGIVAANQSSPSRKSFPQCFEAFARFRTRHPEALLYVHSQVRPAGPHVDLAPLVVRFNEIVSARDRRSG